MGLVGGEKTNRTKIEWTQWTWNPMVGCLGGCSYCYARGQAKRQKQRCKLCYEFKPHLHPERLMEPVRRKKPSLIFADSMSDTFGERVHPPWRLEILEVMSKCPQHIFQDLTKRPDRIPRNLYPPNLWVGVSLEGGRSEWRKVVVLGHREVPHRFVSLEPFLRTTDSDVIEEALREARIEWVIIGALTRNGRYCGGAPYDYVNQVVCICRRLETPVFVKDNCGYKNVPREFPREMLSMIKGNS